MARLIAVCRSDDFEFERRQIGLTIDDTLTMVIQFSDTCIDCEHICGVKQKELERFVQRFNLLSKDEIAVAMMVTSKEIFNLLAQLVPCVGCRRSVERLFNQLVKSGHPALEPLVITSSGVLSINRNYLFDPRAMYALFYIHGAKLTSVMDSIPKSKKNKRCNLHSLDTHKAKTTGSWMDIWEILSQDCREEVVLIDADSLMDTLETYLRKHRFCSECKSKVMRAYSILVGDLDTTEKGYCAALYEGLRYCPQEQHIHILCDSDFIAHLIGRAEPELAGSRRDRHAKTLDIAQEEVLTCLGIHIYERLNRIWQKLRAEEQTWQIMFYLGVDALKKSYEMALERKQGVSNLELMCEELEEEERAKEMKREQKRQKRKKKRAKQNPTELETCIEHIKSDNVSCKCDSLSDNVRDNVSPKKGFQSTRREDPNSNTNVVSAHSCGYMRGRWLAKGSGSLVLGSRCSDAGYSSGAEGCDSCSMPSSNDCSDVACSDSTCSHDGGDHSCSQEKPVLCSCKGSMSSTCKSSSHPSCPRLAPINKHTMHVSASSPVISNGGMTGNGQHGMTLSLQDMLEQSCSSEDEDDFISEEEIQRFKANQNLLLRKRQELRETLRQRFDNMQQRSTDGPAANHHKDLDQLTRELLNM